MSPRGALPLLALSTVLASVLFAATPATADTTVPPAELSAPESATILATTTTLTLTFNKGGAGIVIVDTPPLVHGFTVDGLGSGSVHPSAVAMDNRTVTLELGMGAEPGQTVTVSYDPDMVPNTDPSPGFPEGRHNPLRYTDGTLVAAFSGVPVTVLAPKPAIGLSVSFVSGTTANLSWTLPAQPEGVIVTAVEVHSDMAAPGSTRGPDFSSYGLSRLAADATSQEWPVIHGDFTFHYRVRLVTNAGDADSQVVTWSSDQELQEPATGLTASNATQTTVDLAWTWPEQPAWVAQMATDEIWSEVQQQEADETWSTVAKLAADATAHTVTGLSAGTAYSFRIALTDRSVNANSESVSVTTPAPSVLESATVRGMTLTLTFDERLSQGLAPPGGSFKVTAGPGAVSGGNGGAGANGGTVDIAGTGTATVNGADVTVTLARAVPPGTKVTVAYTPPPDESALRDLEGEKVEEFSGEPVSHGAAAANRAPVVDEQSGNYAGFVASGNAPRGVLVTKGFNGMFSDPDGDELTYTVALSDPGQAALVEVLHVPTEAELAETPRRIEVARRVFFRADAEADWGAMDPAVPDPVEIAVTVTATDPGGLAASVEGVFLTHWAAPRVESVAVVSNAGDDDTYALGETIRVAVTFDERVTVDTSGGTPRLVVDMDPADWGAKWASYKSGSGTRELVFAHEVVEPNYSSQGIAVLADSLETNGGTIRLDTVYRSAPWMDARLAHAGLGHDPKHKVNWGLAPAPAAAVPEVTGVAVASNAGPDDTYGLGETIRVAMTFDAAVTVTGSPGLKIDMDPAAWGEKRAAYESGSGTATLTFAHTVVEPNYSTQGIAVVADSLALDGGTIRTASGTDAGLAHAGLGHDTRHKVDWRPALSVADARANEGANATVDFEISLSRAFTTAGHRVTVDYATSDGTATAGEDYTATSGTLTFAAGESSKTVSVALLDDAHDEGEETFGIRLSNAEGARIADGEATGTVVNADPLQQAWLARFGRTVASDAIAAVTARLETPRDAGSHLTLGGHRLALGGAGDNRSLLPPAPAGGTDRLAWSDGHPATGESRTMSARELLMGTSFRAVLGQGTGSQFTSWGQGASVSRFSGSVPGLSLSGETATGSMGMDYERGRVLAGFAMTHSFGEGTAHGADRSYAMGSSVTTALPFARLAISDRVSAWGLAGSGTGRLTLDLDGGAPERYGTDLAMTLAAVGVRGDLVTPPAAGGFALAFKADAFWVRTESDAVSAPGVGNLAGARAEASRLRAVLDGSRTFLLAGGGTLTPSVALGLRQDGGDAETGAGMEVSAGVGYADPSRGLDMAFRVDGLAGHAEDGYGEWGVSGSVSLAPGDSGRGLSLSLAPSYGADPGGSERLWATPDAYALAADDEAVRSSRLDAELGYGLGAPAGLGVVTPYAALGLAGDDTRTWRAGTRWRVTPTVSFGVEGTWREIVGEPAEHGLTVGGALSW